MRGRLKVWALAGLLSAAPAVGAQEAGKATNPDPNEVQKEDAHTWVATVDGRDYEVRPATPTYFGDTGLFHVSSAYTLLKGRASFSLFRDNLDRDPKNIDFSIHGLNVAYGVTSKLELFGQVGLQNRLNVDNPEQAGYFNDLPNAGLVPGASSWQTGFGDIRIGAKYGFLSDYRGDPLGLAVKASLKLGTADEAKGLGTGKTSFDAHLVASKTLGRSADIHASVGYEWNSDPDGYDIGNALKLGVGINIPSCRLFQVQGELLYTKYQSYNDSLTPGSGGIGPQTNPLDFVVGPVFWIKPGFFIRPALSGNLNFDERGLTNQSAGSWLGRQIEIGYHPGTVCHRIATPPPPMPTPAPANHPPTVSCDVDKSEIKPGESVKCHATGSDPDGDALTYTWSASAGKVTGSGPDATWDSTGVEASAITLSVHVSDGRGGTAEAKCMVRIEKKAGVPVTCSSGGFPVNRERLNNVDKACLDDVATRLKQDPRSRVVIIGHADSKEKYPEVIGRKRAESAKAYLVKERGIDESRISVRSAAGRKPADTGTTEAARKKNRRVEVVFLTEGAELPD
jgi:outer membrane protein OmpA-like peptidoglycan-associated protein